MPNPTNEFRRHLLPTLLVLAGVLAAGTAGFALIEGTDVWHGFYATVLIISTLGFSRDVPATIPGQILTVGLIVVGTGTLFYLLVTSAEQLIRERVGHRKERRLTVQLEALQNHVIICGYGRVGGEIVRELVRHPVPFVVIDPDREGIERLTATGIPALEGDASEDTVLRRAGVERARAVFVCTGTDAVNVFITLSARSLNERLFIAARAIREEDEPKLLRAGANRVITPASLGGRRLASMLLRPTVADLFDLLVYSERQNTWIEEVRIGTESELVTLTIGAAALRDRVGVTVIAVRHPAGEIVANPPSTLRLGPGDILVALGTREALGDLTRLCVPA